MKPVDDEELVNICGRYLWRFFETGISDTPARIMRVVLYALHANGYQVIKQGEHMNQTQARSRDER